jgi:predicted anti-sigma-YlaC factor YlaD
MTCREVLELLADYLDGSLPLRQRLSLDLHLSLCSHCRDYLNNYRQAIQASRDALAGQALCEELPEDLVQAVLAARKLPHHDD